VIDSQVLAFALAAALLTVAPGPDTFLVIRNVVRGGRRDGIVTSFGICSGLFVHATLSAVGVSMLLVQSATVFRLVKLAGACYLVWLGVQSLRGALRASPSVDSVEASSPISRRPPSQSFIEGWLSNVLNPKTAIFYLAFLPQFIGPADPVLQKSLLLTAIHFAQGILWLGIVAFAVDRSRRVFLQPVIRRWMDAVCGTLLVGLGLRLAIQRQ